MSENEIELLPGITNLQFREMKYDLCLQRKGIGWGINTIEITKELADMHGLNGFGRGCKRAYYILPEALKEAYNMVCGECDISSDLETALSRFCNDYHFNWSPLDCSIKYDKEALNDDLVKSMVKQITALATALLVVMHREMKAMLDCPAPEVTKQ